MSDKFNADNWNMNEPLEVAESEQSEYKNSKDKFADDAKTLLNDAKSLAKNINVKDLLDEKKRQKIGRIFRILLGVVLVIVSIVYMIIMCTREAGLIQYYLLPIVTVVDYPISAITLVSGLVLVIFKKNWSLYIALSIMAIAILVFALLQLTGIYSLHGYEFEWAQRYFGG